MINFVKRCKIFKNRLILYFVFVFVSKKDFFTLFCMGVNPSMHELHSVLSKERSLWDGCELLRTSHCERPFLWNEFFSSCWSNSSGWSEPITFALVESDSDFRKPLESWEVAVFATSPISQVFDRFPAWLVGPSPSGGCPTGLLWRTQFLSGVEN